MLQCFLRHRLISLIRLLLSPLLLVRLMPFPRLYTRQYPFERRLRPFPYLHPARHLAQSPPNPPPRAATRTRTPSQLWPVHPPLPARQRERSSLRSSRFLALVRRASPAPAEQEESSARVPRVYPGAQVWVQVAQADRPSSDPAATSPPQQQQAVCLRRRRTAMARSRASNRSPRLAAPARPRNSRRAFRLARRSYRRAPQHLLLDRFPRPRPLPTPALERTATLRNPPGSLAAKARTLRLAPTAAADHQADQASGEGQSRLAQALRVSLDREHRVGCRLARPGVRASRV